MYTVYCTYGRVMLEPAQNTRKTKAKNNATTLRVRFWVNGYGHLGLFSTSTFPKLNETVLGVCFTAVTVRLDGNP